MASEMLFFVYFAEIGSAGLKSDLRSQTFKSMTRVLCSYMAQMGDNSLVLQMIEKVIIDHIVSSFNCLCVCECVFLFLWSCLFCIEHLRLLCLRKNLLFFVTFLVLLIGSFRYSLEA